MTTSYSHMREAGRRALASLAFWVLVGVTLHVGSAAIVRIQLPAHLSGSGFLSLVADLRFWTNPYVATIAAAMCLPLFLEITSKRLAWLWAWFFLLVSVLLPGWVIAMTRAEIAVGRAADMPIKGTGIFGALTVAQVMGLYGATCALIFAGMAARDKPTTHAWLVTPQIGVAASLLLVHLFITSSSFVRFFLYR
jgi:hypothetical protein